MTSIQYPSPEFPGMPGVEVDVPEGWEPISAPGAVLALRAPLNPDHFAPNVVVTVNRYDRDFDLAQLVEGLRTDLAKYPGAKLDEPFETSFGDERYVVVNLAFDHPQAGTLLQVHAFTSVLAADDMKDIVHLTGSCGATRLSTDYPVLQEVIKSARVRPAVCTG